MVMGNGFQEGETLLYDHLHRQSEKSNGMTAYPRSVLRTHEDFTHKIMSSSVAKIEVVYGAPVRDRVIQTMKCSFLPLWDHFAGIVLVLVHESNFENADKRYRFRKVILFAAHPQYLFMEKKGGPVAIQQDLVVKTACLLGNLKLDIDPQYYRLQNWRPYLPSNFKVANLRIERRHNESHDNGDNVDLQPNDMELSGLQSNDMELSGAPLPKDDWCQYFERFSHSNAKTRDLLPAAIKMTELVVSNHSADWCHPSEFPHPVLEWYKGQSDVLFYYGAKFTLEDIQVAFKKCSESQQNFGFQASGTETGENHRLSQMLLNLMVWQQKKLESIKKTELDDLLFNKIDGRTIKTVCPCGNSTQIDTDPRFSCTRKNGYAMRSYRACRTNKCNSQSQQYCATSDQVTSIRCARNQLRSTKAVGEKLYQQVIRKPGAGPPRPNVVKVWCCKCKENTRLLFQTLDKDDIGYTDKNAAWTIGTLRPLYVIPDNPCRACPGGARLVPIDENIPFISKRQLTQFVSIFGNHDHIILAALLDDWPSCSREPRSG